jgi:hypothetical protein
MRKSIRVDTKLAKGSLDISLLYVQRSNFSSIDLSSFFENLTEDKNMVAMNQIF